MSSPGVPLSCGCQTADGECYGACGRRLVVKPPAVMRDGGGDCPPRRDPLNVAREIVDQRLSRHIEDPGERWDAATAIAINLDMAGLIASPEAGQL